MDLAYRVSGAGRGGRRSHLCHVASVGGGAAYSPGHRSVLYRVSDRAKALIQLAEQGLECLSMPDFFHVVHDIVQELFARPWPAAEQAHQELHEAAGGSRTTPGAAPRGACGSRGPRIGGGEANRGDAMGRGAPQLSAATWKPSRSRCIPSALRTRLPRPPPRWQATCRRRLRPSKRSPRAISCRIRHAAMTKVRKQLPALAALVDFWWAGVRQDLAHAALSPLWRTVGWKSPCSHGSIGSTK